MRSDFILHCKNKSDLIFLCPHFFGGTAGPGVYPIVYSLVPGAVL